MNYYHAIAILPGDRQKSLPNKTEEQMFAEIVLPFVSSGAIKAKWGTSTQTYQVIELRVYKTGAAWYKKSGTTLDNFLRSKKTFSVPLKKEQKLHLVLRPFVPSLLCRFKAKSTAPKMSSVFTKNMISGLKKSRRHWENMIASPFVLTKNIP